MSVRAANSRELLRYLQNEISSVLVPEMERWEHERMLANCGEQNSTDLSTVQLHHRQKIIIRPSLPGVRQILPQDTHSTIELISLRKSLQEPKSCECFICSCSDRHLVVEDKRLEIEDRVFPGLRSVPGRNTDALPSEFKLNLLPSLALNV